MRLKEFRKNDIHQLPRLQPRDWEDLRPHFSFYLKTNYCRPMKMEIKGQLIAVGVIVYHKQTCWLSHVIVKKSERNKGIGQKLTSVLVNTIDRKTYPSLLLIATDLGLPIYLKLGFQQNYRYHQLRRITKQIKFETARQIIPYQRNYYQDIISLDQILSGENRIDFVKPHIEHSKLWIENNILHGAYFPTLSDGYIMAKSVKAGLDLIKLRSKKFDHAIIPSQNEPGIHFLNSIGYELKSISRRMVLGPDVAWDPTCIYNRISGQIG